MDGQTASCITSYTVASIQSFPENCGLAMDVIAILLYAIIFIFMRTGTEMAPLK